MKTSVETKSDRAVMVSVTSIEKKIDLQENKTKITRLSYQIFWECGNCDRINTHKGEVHPPSNEAVEQIPCTSGGCESKLSNPFAGK